MQHTTHDSAQIALPQMRDEQNFASLPDITPYALACKYKKSPTTSLKNKRWNCNIKSYFGADLKKIPSKI
jgi:hypothetical protein